MYFPLCFPNITRSPKQLGFLMYQKIFLLFILFSTAGYSQAELPQNYFTSPLEIPLLLSGTFGELRSNHFHSGLDIKTDQKTGLNVHAAGPGYISRIKVQQWGFGHAIYIQHPNGYTTVYGHLKEFAPKIKAYVRKRQYDKESWEIELYPSPEELPVTQGEIIAYSGNSGSSGGPHLHFEVRDGSARPMNPLGFGLDVKDSRAPLISNVFVYPIGNSAYADHSSERQKLRLIALGNNTFKTKEIEAYGKIGFGISATDQLDFVPNKNGAYKIETFCNGSKNFEMVFNKFSFAESRYVNRMIDYSYYETYNDRIQKLFVQPNNPLSIYEHVVENGFIDVRDQQNYVYTIKVSDFEGNVSSVRIPINAKKSENIHFKPVEKTDYYATADHATVFEEGIFDVYIPKGALYEDTYLDISMDGETIHLHHDKTPLHENLTLGFDVSKYSEADKQHLCIARTYPGGAKYYCTTYKKENRFTTHTRTFGTYTLATDDTPPRISPVNFSDGKWISNNSTLTLKITDNFSGISNYRATVNDTFIVMAYDHKTNLITYEFADGIVKDTENHLKVIVTDNVGNSTTFEATFFRKI